MRENALILISISDDEDEEEEPNDAASVAPTESTNGDVPESMDDDVKPDPEQQDETPKKKAAPKVSSHELHTYSAEELAGFKKREMVADAELLDGKVLASFPLTTA